MDILSPRRTKGILLHLFMDHKIRNYRLHPPVMISNEDKCLTTSEPSVVSGDITPDDDIHMKTPTMLEKLKSDKSLPDIPPARKPVKVTRPVPEEDRDPEKFYCEYCVHNFFTKDGVNTILTMYILDASTQFLETMMIMSLTRRTVQNHLKKIPGA